MGSYGIWLLCVVYVTSKKINLTQFVLLLNLLVATVPVSKQFAILHLEIYSINIIIIIMVHILYYSS